MIDLTKRSLPDTVTVDGRDFLINTDFRIWIRFMNDAKTGKPFDCTYLFAGEYPAQVPLESLLEFAKPRRLLPRPVDHNDAICLDFEIDADLIYAAFMEQYGLDLLDVDLHWWKFLALLNGLSDDVTLSKVMGYRLYRKNKNNNQDPYERLRKAWEIIPELTEEEQAEIDEFESQFA